MTTRALAFAGILAAAAAAAVSVGRSFHGRSYATAAPDRAPGKWHHFTAGGRLLAAVEAARRIA